MRVPQQRGDLSGALLDVLSLSPAAPDVSEGLGRLDAAVHGARFDDVLIDDDVQLALFLLYELHYTGIDGVDDGWEWHPRLLAVRQRLESAHESTLRARTQLPDLPPAEADAVAAALFELTAPVPGPSLAHEVAVHATNDQAREFLILRSIYTLKEADPHTWAIPRLRGRAKAALVEVQADEYGGGRPERMHATMFGRSLRGAGLDDTYGAYIDLVPAVTLASLNTMSLFGLNRRLLGAICGHLAAFEMTSSLPSRMYADGFRRLGFGDDVTAYFDEHVEADSVHEQIAGRDLAGALAEAEPALLPDIMFGAAACLFVDGLAADQPRIDWAEGRSALRRSVAIP